VLPLNPAEVLPEILAGDSTTIGERIEALLVEVLSQPALHERLTGVTRAAASEPEVARMMREFLSEEVFVPVARALGGEDATFRLNLLGTQIVGLMMARYVLEVEPLARPFPQSRSRQRSHRRFSATWLDR
jgi:hypothetical protein